MQCKLVANVETQVRIVSNVCNLQGFEPIPITQSQLLDAADDYWIDADGDLVFEYTY